MVGVDFKNDGNADDKQTIIDYSSNYNRILVNRVKLHAFFFVVFILNSLGYIFQSLQPVWDMQVLFSHLIK